MPRKPDQLTQIKRDSTGLLDLWRATVKHFTKILSQAEQPLPASTMDAINAFLKSNSCTFDHFIGLTSLQQLESLDQLTAGLDKGGVIDAPFAPVGLLEETTGQQQGQGQGQGQPEEGSQVSLSEELADIPFEDLADDLQDDPADF